MSTATGNFYCRENQRLAAFGIFARNCCHSTLAREGYICNIIKVILSIAWCRTLPVVNDQQRAAGKSYGFAPCTHHMTQYNKINKGHLQIYLSAQLHTGGKQTSWTAVCVTFCKLRNSVFISSLSFWWIFFDGRRRYILEAQLQKGGQWFKQLILRSDQRNYNFGNFVHNAGLNFRIYTRASGKMRQNTLRDFSWKASWSNQSTERWLMFPQIILVI